MVSARGGCAQGRWQRLSSLRPRQMSVACHLPSKLVQNVPLLPLKSPLDTGLAAAAHRRLASRPSCYIPLVPSACCYRLFASLHRSYGILQTTLELQTQNCGNRATTSWTNEAQPRRRADGYPAFFWFAWKSLLHVRWQFCMLLLLLLNKNGQCVDQSCVPRPN